MTHAAQLETLGTETLARLAGEDGVLLVQDTTSLDFSGHAAVEGLGTRETSGRRGLLVHTTLAVSAQGVPLGVVAQRVWVRPEEALGKRAKRHTTAFADKESDKWVDGIVDRATGQVWAQGVTVCDREAPVYEFLEEAPQAGVAFIVRASRQGSFTVAGEDVFEALTLAPLVVEKTVTLKRRPDREERAATLHLRYGTLTLRRPKRAVQSSEHLTIQAIEVVEPHPPAGETPVHWLLLTSLPLETPAQAEQIVTSYTYRWRIERFHHTRKSGCKLEDSPLRTESRLENLLAVYSGVAWQLLWLTYQARHRPQAPATLALTNTEWRALSAFIERSARPPATPPSLRQAVRWIAQLGGFLGRKGDGEPGLKVLWRGWSR